MWPAAPKSVCVLRQELRVHVFFAFPGHEKGCSNICEIGSKREQMCVLCGAPCDVPWEHKSQENIFSDDECRSNICSNPPLQVNDSNVVEPSVRKTGEPSALEPGTVQLPSV